MKKTKIAWKLRRGDKIKYNGKIITISNCQIYYPYANGNLVYQDNKNQFHFIACNGQDKFEMSTI